ncbi:hypothetical protein Salat_1669700 [Sesamum alatum]|uniref:Uncharacterized protein n=1 Tax=Sesamum alatum TaxID=300844 RepID=A0AAE2CJS5_9LAMI|nr:hypothetical protein Salat_1669700 [Sesamum alatum]
MLTLGICLELAERVPPVRSRCYLDLAGKGALASSRYCLELVGRGTPARSRCYLDLERCCRMRRHFAHSQWPCGRLFARGQRPRRGRAATGWCTCGLVFFSRHFVSCEGHCAFIFGRIFA